MLKSKIPLIIFIALNLFWITPVFLGDMLSRSSASHDEIISLCGEASLLLPANWESKFQKGDCEISMYDMKYGFDIYNIRNGWHGETLARVYARGRFSHEQITRFYDDYFADPDAAADNYYRSYLNYDLKDNDIKDFKLEYKHINGVPVFSVTYRKIPKSTRFKPSFRWIVFYYTPHYCLSIGAYSYEDSFEKHKPIFERIINSAKITGAEAGNQ